MDKFFEKIGRGGIAGVRILAGILALIMAVCALFSLWDMYRTATSAFASHDLLQYRPDIESNEPPYLDKLLEINPDTVCWLTIYDTHIDYPVMQGSTDNEYLNKDVYGQFAITGSIFLATRCDRKLTEPYNLLYGHHMANGAMFGDIEKFVEKDYFDKHKTGIIIMPDSAYDLTIWAVIETNAYDRNVYWVNKTDAELQESLQYFNEKATHKRDVGEIEQLVALSTCSDEATFGRTILLCKMEKHPGPIPTHKEEPGAPRRTPVGHPLAGQYWAVINLLCLLLTIYITLPVNRLKDKFSKENAEIRKENVKFKRIFGNVKFITIMQAILSAGALLTFYLTEDMKRLMQITDRWTPLMVTIMILVYLVEIGFTPKLAKELFLSSKTNKDKYNK